MKQKLIIKKITYEVVCDNGIIKLLQAWRNAIEEKGESFSTDVFLVMALMYAEDTGQLKCLTPESRPWHKA